MKTRHAAVACGALAVVVLSVLTLVGGGLPSRAPGNQDVLAGPSQTDAAHTQATRPTGDAITAWTDGARVPAAADNPPGGDQARAGGAASTDTGSWGGGTGASDLLQQWYGATGRGAAADFGDGWWDSEAGLDGSGSSGESSGGGGDSVGGGSGGGGDSSAPVAGTDNSGGSQPAGTAARPSSGGRIAFTATVGGNQDIYAVDSDGHNQARLTEDAAADRDPAWSPDGKRLAFVRAGTSGSAEIYAMNSDGRDVSPVPTPDLSLPAHPSWSADGQRIAFEARDPASGGRGIYVVTVADGTVLPLTPGDAASHEPAFSPDGSQIAFVREESGERHLHLMNADGSAAHPVGGTRAAHPAWDASGTRIAYDDADGIHVLDVGSGEQVGVTGTYEECPSGANGKCPVLFEPSWAPDGIHLVVRDAKASATAGDLYVTDLVGQDKKALTSGVAAASPRWSPAP